MNRDVLMFSSTAIYLIALIINFWFYKFDTWGILPVAWLGFLSLILLIDKILILFGMKGILK